MEPINPNFYNIDILKFNIIKYCEECTNNDLCKIKDELNEILTKSQMFTRKHNIIFEQLKLFIDAFPEICDDNKPSRGTILKIIYSLPLHIALTSILMNKFTVKNQLQFIKPPTFVSLCGIKTHNENFIRENYERNNKIS